MNALTDATVGKIKSSKKTKLDGFQVGRGANFLSGLFANHPKFWKKMAALESKVVADKIADIEINKPVYVTGLARSGTTLLLEILASHEQVATHQYRDFPALFIPYWWNQSKRSSGGVTTERAHADGMMVSEGSPEAMEEMLWMSCFKDLHNPRSNQVLDDQTDNQPFEKLYRDHLRKLLLVREGRRYIAKGNYNVTRIGYLQKLFSDARFLIPVRRPETHIASLMKQHAFFVKGETKYPRSLTHMQRVGHFEFGLDLRLINTGNTDEIVEIEKLISGGDEIRGWAKYWASIYGWLLGYLAANPKLNLATKLVQYENLCSETSRTLEAILEFVELEDRRLVEGWQDRINPPTYYRAEFTTQQLKIIREETEEVVDRLSTAREIV